eukprot:9806353-Heterocapsa_arctica.AAC.1
MDHVGRSSRNTWGLMTTPVPQGETEHWNTWEINPDAEAAVMHPHDTQFEPWDDDWKPPNFGHEINPSSEG